MLSSRDIIGNIFSETFYDIELRKNILRVVPEEGFGIPLHNTALGKIFLAEMPDEALKRYFKEEHLVSYTPNTIMNINDMKDNLRVVRRDGIAFDDEEFAFGVRGIGAGIRNSEGKLVGSFGVVAPSIRLSRSRMRELIPDVKNCSLKISKELGFMQ